MIKKIRKKIFEKIGSPLFKDMVWVYSSRIVTAVISLASLRVLRSGLSPEDMGVYATALSIQWFIMSLSDLGLTSTTTRLGAEYLSNDKYTAEVYFAWIHHLRIRMLPFLIVGGALASPFLAWTMLESVSYWKIILIPLLGIVPITFISSTYLAILSAEKRFAYQSLIQALSNLLSLLGLIAFKLIGNLTISTALISLVVSGFILFPLLKNIVKLKKYNHEEMKEVISAKNHDIKRVGISQSITAFLGSIEQPLNYTLLNRLTTTYQSGLYYGAMIVAKPILFLADTLSSVMMPRLAKLTNNSIGISKYVNSVLKYLPLGLIVTGLVSIIIPFIVPPVLGDRFKGSIGVAWILMAAYAPGTVLCLLSGVLYPLKMEQKMMWVHIGTFVLNFLLRILLIPGHGAIAIAFSLLLIKIIAWVSLLCLVLWGVKRIQPSPLKT